MTSLILPADKVKAILNGADMFRLPVKPQPEPHVWQYLPDYKQGVNLLNTVRGKVASFCDSGARGGYELNVQVKAKYNVGDVVYLREAWNLFSNVGDCGVGCEYGCAHGKFIYKASGVWDDEVKWRSPVTMPREAARIFLKITGVMVERLQEISEEDAIREGAPAKHLDDLGQTWKTHRRGFEWAAKEWDSNTWVWVYTFERIEKPE